MNLNTKARATYLQGNLNLAYMEDSVQSSSDDSKKKSYLRAFLERESLALLGSIGSYVQRMGLATGEEVKPVALETFQEAVIEALDHAERFDEDRQPMVWLLGIALNVIRRKKAAMAKRQQHEFSFSHLRLVTRDAKPMEQDEVLDQLISSHTAGPEQVVESDEQVQVLLSLVSVEDQQVLRLAILEDFDREALAQRLGVTSGAGRVRLHRALHHLREAWKKQSWEDMEGGNV